MLVHIGLAYFKNFHRVGGLLAEAVLQFVVTSFPHWKVHGAVSADVNQDPSISLLDVFEL